MKKISAYNRTSTPSESNRTKPLRRKKASHLDLDSMLQSLSKSNPLARDFQIVVRGLFMSVEKNNFDGIQSTKTLLKNLSAKLTYYSTQPDFKLLKTQIANFYAISDFMYLRADDWRQSNRYDCLHCMMLNKLPEFLQRVDDVITVAMAIASKRIVFLNHEFAITYGVSKLESGVILCGELFVSIIDSDGFWSFDKDDAVRIAISTLRASKQAVANWRGANISGQVTHKESERIAGFLGLEPVSNSQRNLVMLRGNQKLLKGFGAGF